MSNPSDNPSALARSAHSPDPATLEGIDSAPTSTEEVQRRLQAEANQLLTHFEAITGLTSRWNGSVVIDAELETRDIQGQFRSDGTIAINPTLAEREDRFRTLLHELGHSVAVPISRDEYRENMGWEEGPVEMLQRAVRVEILSLSGLSWDEEVQRQADAIWPFNAYVESFERVRLACGADNVATFSARLLQIKVTERSRQLILEKRSDRKAALAISKESAVLSSRLL